MPISVISIFWRFGSPRSILIRFDLGDSVFDFRSSSLATLQCQDTLGFWIAAEICILIDCIAYGVLPLPKTIGPWLERRDWKWPERCMRSICALACGWIVSASLFPLPLPFAFPIPLSFPSLGESRAPSGSCPIPSLTLPYPISPNPWNLQFGSAPVKKSILVLASSG